jgi:hypothetical protein
MRVYTAPYTSHYSHWYEECAIVARDVTSPTASHDDDPSKSTGSVWYSFRIPESHYDPVCLCIDMERIVPGLKRVHVLPYGRMGDARHSVRVGPNPDALETVYVFDGYCPRDRWIVFELDAVRDARFVEICTHKSETPVAWRSVRVDYHCDDDGLDRKMARQYLHFNQQQHTITTTTTTPGEAPVAACETSPGPG